MKRNSFRFSVYKKQGEGTRVECGSSAAAFPPALARITTYRSSSTPGRSAQVSQVPGSCP